MFTDFSHLAVFPRVSSEYLVVVLVLFRITDSYQSETDRCILLDSWSLVDVSFVF